LASSLNIGAFNLGNALGAWLGGVVIVHGPGLGAVAWAAMLVTLGGLGVALWARALQRRSDSHDNAGASPAAAIAQARACDATA
jgi:DHA1 family inner membrane transport protein